MNKKVGVIIIVAILIGAYAVYAKFFLKRVAIGEQCEASAMCPGECLAVGGLGRYAKGEVCTKACAGPSDCPPPTTCAEIDLTVADPAKGTSKTKRSYCLLPTR
jgi:hypothetical protein